MPANLAHAPAIAIGDDERRGKVVTLKFCVYNSNPFDWQWCSGWIS